MISGTGVLEKISSEYYSLTNAEKKVADYVTAHSSEIHTLSISELASASSVAEATISRFCRKLDYKGYNAFKLALAASTGSDFDPNPLSANVDDDDSFPELCRKLYSADVGAMLQTFELIRPEAYTAAADLLEAAGKVLCMGQGGSSIMAREAAHLFSTASGKFFSVEDDHLQVISAAMAEEGDVILFFSYSGATKDMLDTFRVARRRGVKLILVTRYPNSPGAAEADIVLQCGANENPLQLGSVGARVAQLFLLDVLFSELCRRNLDSCLDSRRRIAEALVDKHI